MKKKTTGQIGEFQIKSSLLSCITKDIFIKSSVLEFDMI